MTHAMETIAQAGQGAVTRQNSTVDQPLANQKARRGAGAALATLLGDELRQQAGKMLSYVQSLMDLDKDGRDGFIGALSTILKERRVLVKENGTPLFKAINASASVRLSEFKKLAEAMNKGFNPDLTQGYHAIVAAARLSVGKDTRGRKATHAIVKALKYIGKVECIDDADKAAIERLLAAAEEICEELGLAVDVE